MLHLAIASSRARSEFQAPAAILRFQPQTSLRYASAQREDAIFTR